MHDSSRYDEVHVESTPVVAELTAGVVPMTVTVSEVPEVPAVVVPPVIALRLMTV